MLLMFLNLALTCDCDVFRLVRLTATIEELAHSSGRQETLLSKEVS